MASSIFYIRSSNKTLFFDMETGCLAVWKVRGSRGKNWSKKVREINLHVVNVVYTAHTEECEIGVNGVVLNTIFQIQADENG